LSRKLLPITRLTEIISSVVTVSDSYVYCDLRTHLKTGAVAWESGFPIRVEILIILLEFRTIT
jgi:hypothetical protein